MAEFKEYLPKDVRLYGLVEEGLQEVGLPTLHVETIGRNLARLFAPGGDMAKAAYDTFWAYKTEVDFFLGEQGMIGGGTPDHAERFLIGDPAKIKKEVIRHIAEVSRRVASGDSSALRRLGSIDHL